ncbi:MAG: DEAD/DEAH box helicase [Candidatus Hadarchaeum sp.]|uniref:DEAD/DEAH box helicase n=1 Tax=Candidatus Hadarchaeum sp. TaxID=2883567 RepID=UPI003D12B08F
MDVFSQMMEPVRLAIRELGINSPTKPQELAIPAILSGKNVLLIAPTGTGKTEAAIFPVFSLHLSQKRDAGIEILYIAPLRALNRDMLKRLMRLCKNLGITLAVRHGDTTAGERQQQTIEPPNMLITTPETLQAIIPGKIIGKHLKAVRWVIVDEIHELAPDKRGVQLAVGLERLAKIAGEFQRIGLSATVGSKDEVARFLAGSNRHVEIIDASMEKEIKIKVESPIPSKDDVALAERLYVEPTMAARLRRLHELINKYRSVLIFVNTRETAETLGSRLKLLDPSLKVGIHHGSLARDIRIEAEEGFRSGRLKGLICTSSMELGIDIGAVDLVIQYMSPRQVVRLVQRVGRSGHRAEAISEGIVIAANPDDIAEAMVIGKKAMLGELELEKFHFLALDVLAHQLVGISLDQGRSNIEETVTLLRKAQPYRDLDVDSAQLVLRQLGSEGMVRLEKDSFSLRRPGFSYYFTNLSMIPDTRRYTIKDIASRKTVGSLDEEFVASCGVQDLNFIMKGEVWRIIEIDDERRQVLVEPSNDLLGAIPAWEGELIPVPFEVAFEVGSLRSKISQLLKEGKNFEEIVATLCREYPVNEPAAGWLVEQVSEQVTSGAVPCHDLLLIETSENFLVLHACFGSLVNQTLALVIAALLTARIGASVAVKVDPYRIAFKLPIEADPNLVKNIITELKPDYLLPLLKITLKDSSIFRWRLVQVAKRFGAIKRDAELGQINLRRLVKHFEGTPIYEEALKETMIEKLDAEKTVEIFRLLQSGKIRISTFSGESPTPLAWPVLNEISGGELILPKRAEREIVRALMRRLDQQVVRLYCLNCNGWSATTRVGRVQDPPVCKKCGAKLITVLPRESNLVLSAIRKQAAGKKLNKEEERLLKKAFQAANLVLTYGKRAIIALSGRGIGPQTATRILRNNPSDEKFYRAILQAERIYSRTRRFWDA